MSGNETFAMSGNDTFTTQGTADDVLTVKPEILAKTLNQFFLIVFGMCVFLMQGGFAFLEAGAVRSKNVTNILIKNVFDCFISGVSYWLFGYAFAFGDGNEFIGWTRFASHGFKPTEFAFWFFQYVFAATAATIVSGAVAERCEFVAYFVYSFFITGFIYPLVTHWVWSGQGFLNIGRDYGGEIGKVVFTDFAGSGCVHTLGGTAAFIGAMLLGPRIGRFHKESKTAAPLRGHSVPIAALGGFLLFFGFLAFNGGSQLSISNDGDGAAVSLAVVNTVLSGSFAAFSALIINRSPLFGNSSWSLLITINGALCGMAAICAGCNNMYPWGAAIVGSCAGVSFHLWSWIVRSLKVDDPLDAVAVHYGGGSLGLLAIAFLHKQDGILFRWDKRSGMFLAWQLAGLVTITAWSGATNLIVFGTLKLLKMLRVPREIELRGLDIPKHNEPAYPVEAYGHGHIEKILQVLEHAGPMKVTQAFEKHNGEVNHAFEEITDQGPYESPEVNRALYHLERHNSSSDNMASKQDKNNQTTSQQKLTPTTMSEPKNGKTYHIQQPVQSSSQTPTNLSEPKNGKTYHIQQPDQSSSQTPTNLSEPKNGKTYHIQQPVRASSQPTYYISTQPQYVAHNTSNIRL